MGRATRWLRSLLGGKKDGKGGRKHSSSAVAWEEEPPPPVIGRENKRPSFTQPRDAQGPVTLVPECSSRRTPNEGCRRGQIRDNNNERVTADHALAVAAATAAAADAATAAAKAAAEVVRLTICGRARETAGVALLFGGRGDWWAAVTIQTAFRGFLARKALRALKALVKLQALVRGYLVRKQAAATLHCMEALIRAQLTVRMQRSGLLLPPSHHNQRPYDNHNLRHYPPEFIRPRRSLERLDDTRSDHGAASSFHTRRMSANLDHVSTGFDESPKIVEVDPGRPKPRFQLRAVNVNPPPPPSEEYSTTDDTPLSRSSPLTVHTPPSRLRIPPSADPIRPFPNHHDWELDHRRFPVTAHSTPRLPRTSPAKSACAWSDVDPLRWHQPPHAQHHYQPHSHPRFMAGTHSSKAKAQLRSQSAPKQRPDPRRRFTLNDIAEPRPSLSSVRMHRSSSRPQGAAPTAPEPAVPRSCELPKAVYEREQEFLDHLHQLQFQRRW